MRKTFGGR